MARQSIRAFASSLRMSATVVFEQLVRAGIDVNSLDDEITDEQRQVLMDYFSTPRTQRVESPPVTMAQLRASATLRELSELMTRAMAERSHQVLIKDEGLVEVVSLVFERVRAPEDELLGAVELGRLAAVARNREAVIFDRADDVFSVEPPSIDSLIDGDAKAYAAHLVTHVGASWVTPYAYRESLAIESADGARSTLLSACLEREQSVAEWVVALREQVASLGSFPTPDARLRRWRRVLDVMGTIMEHWRGDVGANIGGELADLLPDVLGKALDVVDDDVLFDVIDQMLRMLARVIEIRFSMALYASTYAVLERGKRHLGAGVWGQFLNRSRQMSRIRVALLESALVLSRQNRTDREIISALLACYSSRPQVAAAIKRHFVDARDLDPDVRAWWSSAGEATESRREVEHRVGNNEDSQIGALLIEVESNQDAMEKIGRAVVQFLEISEPVLASTTRAAVSGYQNIAQIARRLARMRKLTRTDLKGERLEYNPLEHEMLGGHKSGVRRVRVVRDGIKKEFSGKVKTLVKPWVEADE